MNMLLSTVQNVKVSRKNGGGNSVNAAVEKKEAKTEEREYESDCGTTAVESEQKREKKQKEKKEKAIKWTSQLVPHATTNHSRTCLTSQF
jgi:hypothetical protein